VAESGPKVKLIDLNQHRALQIVRAAAKNSANVFFTEHARQRMRRRQITVTQVMRCLLHGRISEGPASDLKKGGWKVTMEHYSAGEAIGIAVGIESVTASAVAVITVFRVN
jgi:hypothetical protein